MFFKRKQKGPWTDPKGHRLKSALYILRSIEKVIRWGGFTDDQKEELMALVATALRKWDLFLDDDDADRVDNSFRFVVLREEGPPLGYDTIQEALKGAETEIDSENFAVTYGRIV